MSTSSQQDPRTVAADSSTVSDSSVPTTSHVDAPTAGPTGSVDPWSNCVYRPGADAAAADGPPERIVRSFVELQGPAVPKTRTVSIKLEKPRPAERRSVHIEHGESPPAEPRSISVTVFDESPEQEARRQRGPSAPTAKDRMAAARALIHPQPAPKRTASRIVFEPDATPADAEDRLRQTPTLAPVPRPRPGPVARSASPERKAADEDVRTARAAISPYATMAKAAQASKELAGPVLTDEELEAVIAIVVQQYGPILDINTASAVSKLARQTIRERVCHGLYADSVIRGRPLRFWSHRFLKAVMTP